MAASGTLSMAAVASLSVAAAGSLSVAAAGSLSVAAAGSLSADRRKEGWRVPWTRTQEIALTAGAALMLAGSAVLLVARRPAPPIRIIDAPRGDGIVVQVDGAVARPGVYPLASGARVGDALAAAGGTHPDADLGSLNRARALRDGDRVTVPYRRAPTAVEGAPQGDAGTTVDALDLNSATPAELETLPGVGPVLARRIVEHRTQRGPFRRVDDLLQVKGVGPRLLERLRAHVVIR